MLDCSVIMSKVQRGKKGEEGQVVEIEPTTVGIKRYFLFKTFCKERMQRFIVMCEKRGSDFAGEPVSVVFWDPKEITAVGPQGLMSELGQTGHLDSFAFYSLSMAIKTSTCGEFTGLAPPPYQPWEHLIRQAVEKPAEERMQALKGVFHLLNETIADADFHIRELEKRPRQGGWIGSWVIFRAGCVPHAGLSSKHEEVSSPGTRKDPPFM